jgi:hypothetical protein
MSLPRSIAHNTIVAVAAAAAVLLPAFAAQSEVAAPTTADVNASAKIIKDFQAGKAGVTIIQCAVAETKLRVWQQDKIGTPELQSVQAALALDDATKLSLTRNPTATAFTVCNGKNTITLATATTIQEAQDAAVQIAAWSQKESSSAKIICMIHVANLEDVQGRQNTNQGKAITAEVFEVVMDSITKCATTIPALPVGGNTNNVVKKPTTLRPA